MANSATALRDHLIADAAVSALVGTKIYWDNVPQNTARPYVRLQIISDPRPEHLKGYNGRRQTWFQASCFSDTFLQAKDIGAKIKAAVAAPWSATGGNFGRVKAEGPVGEAGETIATGFIYHARVDLRAEHTFDD
jgi:hypothetical protein